MQHMHQTQNSLLQYLWVTYAPQVIYEKPMRWVGLLSNIHEKCSRALTEGNIYILLDATNVKAIIYREGVGTIQNSSASVFLNFLNFPSTQVLLFLFFCSFFLFLYVGSVCMCVFLLSLFDHHIRSSEMNQAL
jgi:hypothetical protein